MRRWHPPPYLRPGSPCRFPDPSRADADGLVAVGGDLSVKRLMTAYGAGIFPWYEPSVPPLWWSPDPRGVLFPVDVHVSRSLTRSFRRGGFRLTWNRCFRTVMQECGRRRRDGTWIFGEMIEAYVRLHEHGLAHSLEVWAGDRLAGGIYGVQVGGLFAAESMFHRVTDASKIALVALARSLWWAGIRLIDVQFVTPHLRGLGAVEISRGEYLAQVARLRDLEVDLAKLEPAFERPSE